MSKPTNSPIADPDADPLVDRNLVVALRLTAYLYENGLFDTTIINPALNDAAVDEINEIVGFIYDSLNKVEAEHGCI